MKRLFISIILSWFTALSFASNPAYEKAMQQAIGQLEAANSPEEYQTVANQFQRIAQAEPDEWLPLYYATYAHIIRAATSQEGEQKDQSLNQAQEYLDQAKQLTSGESEIITLQGYIHMIRVTIDPASRGPELAPLATQTLAQAVQMNPNNPRAYLLLGQMQYGTAQFFNSDTTDACGLISQSVVKFKHNEPSSPLHPSWGREIAESLRESCK